MLGPRGGATAWRAPLHHETLPVKEIGALQRDCTVPSQWQPEAWGWCGLHAPQLLLLKRRGERKEDARRQQEKGKQKETEKLKLLLCQCKEKASAHKRGWVIMTAATADTKAHRKLVFFQECDERDDFFIFIPIQWKSHSILYPNYMPERLRLLGE